MASAPISLSVCLGNSAPEGFEGLLSMIALVLGLIAD